jgi:predicted DNA-binding transcriptional regulator YafY
MSKYDRLLHILNLLRARRGLKAADLAKECEVSERTIYRDIIALSLANVPVYFDHGYRFLSNAFLPTLNFTLDDYLVLKLSLTSSVLMENSPLRKHAKAVLAKIEANLDPALKKESDKISEPLKISVKETFDFSKLSLVFKLIEQCILNKKSLQIEYESLQSGRTTRLVDPYSLIFRRYAWYLVGFCHRRNEIRIFRLNRIKKVTLSDKSFETDPNFSLASFFKDSWDIYQGEPVIVKIKFKGMGARVIESGPYHPSEKTSKLKDGSLIYEVKVNGIEEISRWIFGFDENAEVLEPKELRDKIRSTARKLSRIYGKTEGKGSRVC